MDELGAWFDTPSLSAGAAVVGRWADAGPLPDIDLRPSGLRVRPAPGGPAPTSDPAALQELRIVFDAVDTAAVKDFWRTAFGYRATGGERLVDPLHRDPDISVLPTDDVRPLRNRFHVDVVRPSAVVETVRGDRKPTGAWGVMLPDSEGNELDLVPQDSLSPEASDWQTLFAAMTFYPTASAAQAVQLVTAVAQLADAAGIPLGLDIRADGVVLDHGKDKWEEAGEAFVELATRIQTAAHDLGLTAKTDELRFVQLGLDAVDVPAVQAFWATVLGYTPDPRVEVGEIYDPRRLNPGFIFQQLDASETERRQQRNRIRLELDIAHDQLPARVAQALQAGGQIRAEQPGRCSLTDPEGNELDLVTRNPL
ncbi:VOC family protein [Kribbella sp. NPDC056345]|uniref:VOC family protein n=1 Tax=Kribbella sp. NPDC056345 TaxID=3345789 RepID=UPI0035DF3450